MASLRSITIPPPHNGLNTVAPPGELPAGTAPLVKNFLPQYSGKMLMRGPIGNTPYPSINVAGSSQSRFAIVGAWNFDDKILLSFANLGSATEKFVPPWAQPFWRATEAKQLGTGYGRILSCDVKTGAVSPITIVTGERAPMGYGARLGRYVYGPSYGSEGQSTGTLMGGLQYKRPLLRWDGTTALPTPYTKGPFSAQYVKAHLERLFVLGGTDPGVGAEVQIGSGSLTTFGESVLIAVTPEDWAIGAKYLKVGNQIRWETVAKTTRTETIKAAELVRIGAVKYYQVIFTGSPATESSRLFRVIPADLGIEPNSLFYSIQGGPTSDVITDWQDPVSGLVNKIVIGDDDQNDYGVALAKVGQNLIIFKRHSIWGLYGYSPETYSVRNITNERGCIEPWSICEVDGGVFFLSQNGLEFFDGTEFKHVDHAVSNITRPIAKYIAGEKGEQKSATEVMGRVTTTYLGNNYLMICFSFQSTATHLPPTPANTNPVWTGYLHIPTGNWATFSSDALASVKIPLMVGSTAGIPWLYDGSRIWQLPWVTDPYGASMRGLGQIDVEPLGTKKGIPAEFISDRINLGSPMNMTQLHKIQQDYTFPNGAGDNSSAKGWYLTLMSEFANKDLLAETQLEGQGDYGYLNQIYGPGLEYLGEGTTGTKYNSGRRANIDVFTEAIDARVKIRWPSTETTVEPDLAEIYSTTLEVQNTRERRTV
jgi:hypothetical protein